VDQAQQLCCALFQAVWAKLGSKRLLWERMRALFYDYAFASMRAAGARQFHDRHPAYSDFVVRVLNKIAAPLDARVNDSAGCGEDDCPGNKAKKPFDPPYNLLARLYTLAGSLQGKLMGSPRSWKMPLMTSRFALMYKVKTMTEDLAREALRKGNFS